MNIFVIGLGREKDLIIGYGYRLKFSYRAPLLNIVLCLHLVINLALNYQDIDLSKVTNIG